MICKYFFMPDSPENEGWLNDREKAIALKRMADDQLGAKDSKYLPIFPTSQSSQYSHLLSYIQMGTGTAQPFLLPPNISSPLLTQSQAREALTDRHVWMIMMQMFLCQAIGSVTTNFLGIIIRGFGYSDLTAQLFTAPNYAVQGVSQLIVSSLPTFSRRFRDMKQPLTAAASVIALVGIAILFVTPDEEQYQSRRLGAVIIVSCSGVNYTVIMSVIGANVTGFTKKQLTTSGTFFLYCVINIITPQTFMGSESPRYPTGLTFVLA